MIGALLLLLAAQDDPGRGTRFRDLPRPAGAFPALASLGGGGEETEAAVAAALQWLARHQDPDGSWKTVDYVRRCTVPCSPNPGDADWDGGNTGLALLAFLGAGYTHRSRDLFGDGVGKALRWVLQQPDGRVGPRTAPKSLYTHAICTQALSEAFRLTGSPLLEHPAQQAVDFLVAAQNLGFGWRYGARCGDNDTSVTAWAIQALRSAELAGLRFPAKSLDDARAWLEKATDAAGRTGYTRAGTGKVFIPGS